MELKLGYKLTEVGLVPTDWNVKPLGCFVALRRGHDLTVSAMTSGDVPVFGSAGFSGYHDTAVAKGPGVLLGRSGASFGRAHFCELDYWPHNTALYVTDFLGNLPIFAFYLLSSIDFTRHNSGGAQQSLNRNFIAPILLAFPKRVEQQRIAEALHDAEVLTGSLEQALLKKRWIKQGAIQELLTGKRRLQGFSGTWQSKTLSTLGKFLKGRGVPRDRSLSGNIACVRYGEIYTRHNEYVRRYYSWISPEIAADATRIRRGDILFAGSGETKAEIGKCVAIVDNVTAYAGGDIVILRTECGDPTFLGYYLNTPFITLQKASKGQGDAVVHIGSSALSEIECFLPNDKEQLAIGQVLRSLDDDIDCLVEKIGSMGRLKQGMMQELLTGRIRLV